MDQATIKKIRTKAGLTQAEFAAEIGVSRKLIEMMEQGIKPCSPRTETTINLWLQVNKKRAAQDNPYCPFCKTQLEIQRIPGAGLRLKPHQYPSGIVQLKTSFVRSKEQLLHAVSTPP